MIRAARGVDRMVISGLTDERPPIQACASAVAGGADARHGQVVWVCDGEHDIQQLW